MDTSKLRQQVHDLDQRRRRLIHQVLRPQEMVLGSLYQMRRGCGKPRCKCARGQPHVSWYLSRRQEGGTKLTYTGQTVPDWLSQRVRRYQRHQKILAHIRKMDAEISRCLNQVRDQKLKGFEQAQRERS